MNWARLGPIMQVAYVVEDLRAAIEQWARIYNVGPFLLLEHLVCDEFEVDGKLVNCDISLALANSGDLQIELIQQHDYTPTIYLDENGKPTKGVNHLGICTNDLESDEAHLRSAGLRRVQRMVFSTGVEVRYYQGFAAIIELIQRPDNGALFDRVKRAAVEWDGVHPYIP